MITENRSTAATDFLPIVDVLRAIAIALVVAYHAVPGFVPGGLVGVDVFFVISGFLILGQIAKSVREKQFSLLAFYKRRALRIIPPYAIVVSASAAAACVILVTPQDLLSFKRDLVWSGAFAANILYADLIGYFDNAASRRVLLHLWSLGIEEQFYIVAPLGILATIAVAGLASTRHRFTIAIAAGAMISCVSLAACILASGDVAPQEAFYLPQFRLWEFLLGGATRAAIPLLRGPLASVRDIGIVAGLGLILVAAGTYSPEIAYPGYFALLPALGAAMVIAGGAERSGLLVRWLATPPVLFLGLISYELYLWHWPILVLARIANFGELRIAFAVGCVLGAILLAAATHFLLARGVATLRRTSGVVKNLLILAAILLCYAAIVATLNFGVGLAVRTVQMRIPPLLVPDQQRSRSCNLVQAGSPRQGCTAQLKGRGTGLLLGDSHATTNFVVFAEHARSIGAGLEFAAFPGCSPFMTVVQRGESQPATCRRWHADIRQALERGEARFAFAIISAQWMFHTEDLIGPSPEEAFTAGLRADLETLRAAGARRILVIGSPPVLRREPGDCIVRADRFGYDRNAQCAVPRARYAGQTRDINTWIKSVIADDPGVRFLDPASSFCGEQWCSAVTGDIALYSDHSHLSRAGTELLAKAAGGDLDWVMSAIP